MFGVAADAQKRKKTVVRKAQQAKVEIDPEVALYDEMLSSTARVMFVDSMVTDKSNVLNAIVLSRPSGSLSTYDAFWKTTGQESSFTYMNDFGNRVLFSKKDTTGHSFLYSADKLSGEWSEPKRIDDFGDDFEDINCPYLMSDGVTLYFAAKGKNGVGGYDIYVTMYDTDSARFYKPENIGLPYNSHANDYYYVIDEFSSIGWLVTDRNQPEGKVCVYTFIPSDSRETYNEDVFDEEHLRRLASIHSISDTWTDEKALDAARDRLSALRQHDAETTDDAMSFYINDQVVYSSPTAFRVQANRQRYTKLTAMLNEKSELDDSLDVLRRKYNAATNSERRSLSLQILNAEQQSEKLLIRIIALEKDIRNTENKALNNQ